MEDHGFLPLAKAADIGSKRLVSLAPDNWVKWVTQQNDVVAQEILSSEFQWISRESDVLVKVHSPALKTFMLLSCSTNHEVGYGCTP